ncbi:hypothetical protein ACIRRH_43655 [Kitasatospora sp. NPDC101235]|uniref:hypothetical protein n=1 Tax=Kitasatospora sp. NPDC101235 TaxID=3364101 RepID=UPI0037F81FC4
MRVRSARARAVYRYLKGERKNPPVGVAKKLEAEVRRDWKPSLQRQAAKAARQRPITINTRAQFGYVLGHRHHHHP